MEDESCSDDDSTEDENELQNGKIVKTTLNSSNEKGEVKRIEGF